MVTSVPVSLCLAFTHVLGNHTQVLVFAQQAVSHWPLSLALLFLSLESSSQYVAQTGLELVIVLSQLSRHWYYRSVPPLLTCKSLVLIPKGLFRLQRSGINALFLGLFLKATGFPLPLWGLTSSPPQRGCSAGSFISLFWQFYFHWFISSFCFLMKYEWGQGQGQGNRTERALLFLLQIRSVSCLHKLENTISPVPLKKMLPFLAEFMMNFQ